MNLEGGGGSTNERSFAQSKTGNGDFSLEMVLCLTATVIECNDAK